MQVIRRRRCWHDCMLSRLTTNMEEHRRNGINKSSGAEMKRDLWEKKYEPNQLSLGVDHYIKE